MSSTKRILGLAFAPLFAVLACSSPEGDVAQLQQSVVDCSTLSEWTVKAYQGGDKVKHGGRAYQCKPAPYSGWCGQVAYEPGVTSYWNQAWSDVDACSGAGNGSSAAPPAATCDTAECCTAGQPLILTQGPDQKLTTAANTCVVALGGSDNIQCSSARCVVLGGPGSDTIMAGDAASVRGGDGDDVINAYGASIVLGNAGNDDIAVGDGAGFVHPGAGADRVTAGSGDDMVVIYDECELAAGERLDGGAGTDTLVTPFDLAELRRRGITVLGFENIDVRRNSCKSECSSKPSCGQHGRCVEGATTGATACACEPGYSGPNCEKFCASTRDTDQDGILDCDDPCPLHAKASPGLCGCAVADTDSDQDGTPDCRDRCPNDAAHIAPGECGCSGEPSLKPAGTACAHAFCPGQSNATCTAAGVCGDFNQCKPEPICKPLETAASNYFICTNRSWQDAARSCAAKGMRLARIDTYDENERLRGRLPTAAWIGGNSLAASGAWRWANDPSGAGDQFWSGGDKGTIVDGRFAFWAAATPSSNRCLSLDPKDGRWRDRGCDSALPYICEYAAPGGVAKTPVLALAAQPEPLVCPSPPSNMAPEPGCVDVMNADASDAEQGNYHGYLANPPAKGSKPCGPEPKSSVCPLTDVQLDSVCEDDKSCAAYGPDYVCRLLQDKPTCDTKWQVCDVHPRCGLLDCKQDEQDDCEQVDICAGAQEATFDTVISPDSQLAVESPPASSFFKATPDFANSTDWIDPATVKPGSFEAKSGVKNLWCKLRPQQADEQHPAKLQPAELATKKNGKSKGGSKIDFNFDPNLVFNASPNPLALGETNLKLEARASLNSGVTLHDFLLFKGDFTKQIIEASAGVVAERCRIKTSDSRLRLLDLDFTDQLPAALKFDTDLYKSADGSYPGRECSKALLQFQEAADRVKKAFYDAQTVLTTYRDFKKNGFKFRGDFCEKLGITNELLTGFPGGNVCPAGEPPELTIDRLLWYYQGDDGNGQIDGMTDAAAGLSDVTSKLLDFLRKGKPNANSFDIPLNLPARTETKNLFTTTFMIGPVPVTIQVDGSVSYGLGGLIDFGVNFPTSLNGAAGELSNPDSPQPTSLAHARVSVEPYAAAGMSLYAAVGTGYVSFGVEGAISLARVRAPFRSGVGLGMASVGDTRDPPKSLTDLAFQGGSLDDAMPFGRGRAYRFYLTYDYGASIRVEEILSGTVNGKARLKVGFFRRTWRKKIYEFHGLKDLTFPLLEGNGRAELFTIGDSRIQNANDISGMGLSEPQVPLFLLEPLPLPADDEPAVQGERDFEPGELERPFYDDLCCSRLNELCGSVDTPSCCGELQCEISEGDGQSTGKCVDCRPRGAACGAGHGCCAGHECIEGSCQTCRKHGEACETSEDCCGGEYMYCNQYGKCVVGS